MSRTALILGLALLAAACGDKQPDTLNSAGGDADAVVASENVVTGDVTAIDAAVADDANMAADVPPPSGEELGNNAADPAGERPSGSERRRNEPAAGAASEAEPADEPAAEANEA